MAPNFTQRPQTHGVERTEDMSTYFDGPAGIGPNSPEGAAAVMPPDGTSNAARGLCGDNRYVTTDPIETLQPSGPHPVLSAPDPGGRLMLTGGSGVMKKLATIGRMILGRE